jgi:hypothetical protein
MFESGRYSCFMLGRATGQLAPIMTPAMCKCLGLSRIVVKSIHNKFNSKIIDLNNNNVDINKNINNGGTYISTDPDAIYIYIYIYI